MTKLKINGIMKDENILWKKLKCKCDKTDIEKSFPLIECKHCKCHSATTYYGTFQSGLVRNRNYSAQLPYANNKFGITNTDYFEFNVLNGNTGFCGIQIK